MRNRVLDAAAAVGYEPDLLAQSLRRGATMTIGFVVGEISNPLLAQIALGAETKLRSAGYSMLLTNSVNEPGLDAQHIRLLRRRRVDGLLLSLADESAQDTVTAVTQAKIPCVLIDRDLPAPATAVGAVLSDHSAGVTAATEHLLRLGHRCIGLVNGNPHVRPARERDRALRRACRRHPAVVAMVRSGSYTAAHGEAATASLLAAPDRPTAIIAGGNQILAGVLRALRRAGMAAPSDISVVTCDDVPLSEFIDPPIATIVRDPEEMGTVAAEILLEQLRGRSARNVILPVQFRPTASCGHPAS
jgi:LacI family transcriptional regulator